jgi:hypothetical protein
MQAVPMDSAPSYIPLVIAVAVGALAIAFAVVRRMQGSGDAPMAGRRFPPHQASRPVMAVIAALIAIGAGLGIVFAERRGSVAAGAAEDSLSLAPDAAAKGSPMVLMIAIGVLALVALAVALLKLRDGDR